ncbi:NADH-ubiquinone oxidoreductase-F iron-sulfur binding region domain-containing protein [Cupriavidus taiwanensis]|uniref:Tungsten-containing formate dehydrogenase beta subunit n=1 Tax=Cupriavidus taiwanensis TaxID=164546 RepID=A0A375IK48_9BURK|nr:NADH-ubiquinone oxidoreductase-F iron-sulfur binding region domain-containing protein [Cupriavidus taiwanensis]SOY66232.1 tungsten-containing formate dehydrogenase beta subunit [Cupriavidus taiwanensis]SOY66233.1 tungsten-containing formate dehydrogenase beta subunit [Cupriavidus taiwanensis]SOY94285.1 tungsten-containing formate dehydrogenase beta subunit [Cupriavidus taiwanensis]SOZ27888.1 tungsten-containing formate dehydrogenase beta subunit [Cupriavidus taiwanensis]SOZ70430.1 tungsten-
MNQVVIPLEATGLSRQRKRRQPKGRQVDAAALAEVRVALGDMPRRRDLLIEHLHCISDRYGQLAMPHLVALASELRLSMTEVYEVATFYHHFDVVREDADGQIAPPPALTVRVCEGIACELAGAQALIDKLPALLGTEVRVIAAPCIGRCEKAPAALVGQNPVDHATAEAIGTAVQARAVRHAPEPHIDYHAYRRDGGYALLQALAGGDIDPAAVLATMEDSGLRGLGGAGFPTGRKWRIVRGEAAPRLMAVNIDEGEPGTFKDRVYLERDPHRFLEGMLIAAHVVDVAAIYIYLRDEYAGCRALLAEALQQLQQDPPLPGLPRIELRRGAGAYICGEESAMIESIEGKRGMPRLRPPYVAQVGLFGRPTLEHNFETLYWVRDIIEKGAEWFAAQGRNGRKGLRSFSVSGRVKRPGVHLAPAGITVRELIDEYCGGMLDGHAFYGYLPGGASGGILPAALGNIPLDFDTLQPYGCFIGSAAIVILSDHDSATQAARNLMHFFKHESCGQCTPCRTGTAKTLELIRQPKWDLAALDDLSAVMRDASICGLGQAAPNPVDCVIKYFPHELA